MKILLINRLRTDNYGDQAISISMQKLIEEVFPDSTIFSEDIAYSNTSFTIDQFLNKYRFLKPLKKVVSRLRSVKIFWQLENAGMYNVLRKHKFDYIIIGGGELIQSNGLFPIGLKTWADKIKKYQKDVSIVLFGVGVTKKFSEANFRYISKTLSMIDKIYVRDKVSAINLKNTFNYDSMIVPDVVFYNTFDQQMDKKNIILYGITSWARIKKYGIYATSKIDYYERCIRDINKYTNQGLTVYIFYTTQADYTECISFIDYCSSKHIEVNVVTCKTLEELLSVMTSAKAVSSPRMHGCILGLINGSEVYPQVISPKMQSFCESYFNKRPIDTNKLKGEIKIKIKEIIKQ